MEKRQDVDNKEDARPAVYYDFDKSTPLDLKQWIQNYGSKEIYFGLLPKFEDNGFLEHMFYLAYWVQVGNFLVMKDKAHAVKGSAAYAGASRISDDWYWIQVWFEKAEYVNMMKHYLKLLEHSAQFRVFWRIVYYKYRKESYVQKPEDEDVPMPVGYSLKKVGDFEFKVSYPEEYLELAEEAERRRKKYIKLPNDKIEIIYLKDEEFKDDTINHFDPKLRTAQGNIKFMGIDDLQSFEEKESNYFSIIDSDSDEELIQTSLLHFKSVNIGSTPLKHYHPK